VDVYRLSARENTSLQGLSHTRLNLGTPGRVFQRKMVIRGRVHKNATEFFIPIIFYYRSPSAQEVAETQLDCGTVCASPCPSQMPGICWPMHFLLLSRWKEHRKSAMIPGLSEWRLEVTTAIGDPFYWTAVEKRKKGVVR